MAWYDFLTGAFDYVPDQLEDWARGGYDWLTEPRLAPGEQLPGATPDWSDLDKAWSSPPAPTPSHLERAVDAALSGTGELLGSMEFSQLPRTQETSLSASMGEEEPMAGGQFPYRPVRFSSRETSSVSPPPEAEPVYRPLTEMPVAERTQQQMIEQVKAPSFIGDEGGTKVYPGKGVMVGGMWVPTTMGAKRNV